jgi:hypothetical protein
MKLPPGLFRPIPFFLCLALNGLTAALSSASAQDYAFTKIIDSNDPIPGGLGTLFVPSNLAAIDNGSIIFRNGNDLAPDSIWSVTGAASPIKLVDLNTTVPGGTGEFTSLVLDFSAPGLPVLSNGTVIFAGRDSASTGYTGGIYSVPATGGTITRIANRNVSVPGGAGNFDNGLQYFSVKNGKVAFNGVSSGGSLTGIYSANTNGTSLTVVADSSSGPSGVHLPDWELRLPIDGRNDGRLLWERRLRSQHWLQCPLHDAQYRRLRLWRTG